MNTPADASDTQINALVDAHELEQRVVDELGPLQSLYDWVHAKLDAGLKFTPRESCKCPVSYYLRDRLGQHEYMPSVGDDQVHIYPMYPADAPALATVSLPEQWHNFVSSFDEFAFEYATAREVEALLERHAAAWGIRA